MTVLSVVKSACTVIGLSVPSSLYSATARELVELQDLANEMAQRIAFDTHDWTKLKTLATLTGTGVATAFDFPSDYKRMIKKARLWPSASPYTTLTHYPDTDQWLGMQVQNFQMLQGAWTIIGEQIQINPAVKNAGTVKFYYITNKIVKDNAGVAKALFTADDDVFRLDERVLKLGIIWQWRANKGVPYAEDLQNYEDALAVASGSDRGSNIQVLGRPTLSIDADYAWPGTIVP